MIYPTNIFQIDRYAFCLEWSDGMKTEHKLADLQKECPCKGCQEGLHAHLVDPLVLADKVEMVGKYGFRILYTSGCSLGIYSFELLRRLGKRC